MTYLIATEPRTCTVCENRIEVGEDYIVDTDTGHAIGYECGCGDPYYAD